MIAIEVLPAPLGDLVRVGAIPLPVQRLAVEGRERTEVGRGLARIQGSARGVAVHIDHRAAYVRAHSRRAHLAGEGVELVDPPVAVLASQPRRHEALLYLTRDIDTGMREADDQRPITPADLQPFGHGRSARDGSS